MKRVDKGDGVIVIEHDQTKDQWLVQRKMLQNTTKVRMITLHNYGMLYIYELSIKMM